MKANPVKITAITGRCLSVSQNYRVSSGPPVTTSSLSHNSPPLLHHYTNSQEVAKHFSGRRHARKLLTSSRKPCVMLQYLISRSQEPNLSTRMSVNEALGPFSANWCQSTHQMDLNFTKKEYFLMLVALCHHTKGDTALPGRNFWQWSGFCSIIDPTYTGRNSSSGPTIHRFNGFATSGNQKVRSQDGCRSSEYNFKVIHRPSKQHLNADRLSRQGPCKQCNRELDEPATEVKCPERIDNVPITRRIATNLCAIALIPEWTANQLAIWQEADDDLNPVVSALKEGQLPTAKLQAGFSAKTKRCFAEWERLKLRSVVY